jgi:hypothetical protein
MRDRACTAEEAFALWRRLQTIQRQVRDLAARWSNQSLRGNRCRSSKECLVLDEAATLRLRAMHKSPKGRPESSVRP